MISHFSIFQLYSLRLQGERAIIRPKTGYIKLTNFVVYKMPYRRARAWPSALAKVSCIQLISMQTASETGVRIFLNLTA